MLKLSQSGTGLTGLAKAKLVTSLTSIDASENAITLLPPEIGGCLVVNELLLR